MRIGSGLVSKILCGFLLTVAIAIATWWGSALTLAGVPTPGEWLRMRPGAVKCRVCDRISETKECVYCGTVNDPPLIP